MAPIILKFYIVASHPGYFTVGKGASETRLNGRVCGPPNQSIQLTEEIILESNRDFQFIQAIGVTVLT